jgi:hypothetical protein
MLDISESAISSPRNIRLPKCKDGPYSGNDIHCAGSEDGMYMDAYADAVRPEQIEQAISLAVVNRFKRPHIPLEDCVELAVEQVFCPCLSHHEGEGKMPSMSIRAGIVGSIVGYLKQGVCTAWAGSDVSRIERREQGAETGLQRIDQRTRSDTPARNACERG